VRAASACAGSCQVACESALTPSGIVTLPV
jgi:hypothetical protein